MNHLMLHLAQWQTLYPHSAELVFGLLKSSAILMMAAAMAAALRNRSARTRNWVWRCTVAGLLGLALWQVLPGPVRPNALAWRAVPANPQDESEQTRVTSDRKTSGGAMSATEQVAQKPFLAGFFDGVEKWVTLCWVAISLILTGFCLLRAWWASRWLRRHSWADNREGPAYAGKLEVRLAEVPTPLLAGFLRPAIYLPAEAAGWPAENRRHVLRHEAAHWSRGDIWWQMAGSLAAALWWWNPLAWSALGRLKAEAEEAADDLVVLQEGRADAYARLLVKMAAGRTGDIPGGISMLGRSSLEQRIRGILNQSASRNKVGAWNGGLLGLLSILILLCLSTGLVLGEADLTNWNGEIVHWQANPENNQLAQGTFSQNHGKLDGWTGALASVATPADHEGVRLKAGQEAAQIETFLPVQAGWKWLTVMARLRPGGKDPLGPSQEAAVSFFPESADGKSTGASVVILEDRREGYTNWTSRIQTMRVAEGTTQLRVQMRVTPGPGQLDCSEILVIPSKPSDELDHRLVDRFFKAIEDNDARMVDAMLKEEPKLANSRKGRADNGTPLVLCAWLERPEIAQILVDHGANLEATDASSWRSSALAWCGWWGSPKTAEVLLKAGANPNFKSIHDVTPLSAAEAGKKSNKASKATPEAFDQTIGLFKAAQK